MPSLFPLIQTRQEQSQNISTATRAAPLVPISLHGYSRLQTQGVNGATARAPSVPAGLTLPWGGGEGSRDLGTVTTAEGTKPLPFAPAQRDSAAGFSQEGEKEES